MKLIKLTQDLSRFYLPDLFVLMLVLTVLTGCEKSHPTGDEKTTTSVSTETKEPNKSEAKSEKVGLKLSAEEMKAAGVKIITLEEQQVNNEIIVTASIQANQDKLAHVAPRVAGKVIKVMAN